MSADLDPNEHGTAAGGDAGASHEGHDHHGQAVTILVNNISVTMPRRNASGAQIKERAGVPSNETLFFLSHGEEEVPVADDEVLHLSEGERFETGPDGGVS